MARVVLTQPAPRISSVAALLRKRGHEVLELPLVRLEPDPPADLQARVSAADWVIAVSPSALSVLAEALAGHWPGSAGLALVGPGSRARYDRQHWSRAPRALRLPEAAPWDAAALMAGEPFDHPGGLRCLVARGQTGREDWIDSLRSRGAQVESVALYRRFSLSPDPRAMAELDRWSRESVPISWVFTQASTPTQWSDRLGSGGFGRRAKLDRALVIHPRIEAAARRAGFGQVFAIDPGTAAMAVALES